jgi:16S rRNA (uracil1498-N3)-methyltransferase
MMIGCHERLLWSQMTRRYYHPDLPPDGGRICLSEAEHQHAAKVMRVQVGDAIELFDGRGNQAAAVIAEITRQTCRCDAQPSQAIDREPSRELHLAIALPKPDRARELIERLTELGVTSVTPLKAERTQRAPTSALLNKLRRGCIEACKQSGRNVLLEVHEPLAAGEFFPAADPKIARWLAHPGGVSVDSARRDRKMIAAIGPEGGWTEQEVSTAQACGFELVDCGARIYRIETAAAFVAARLLD